MCFGDNAGKSILNSMEAVYLGDVYVQEKSMSVL